MKAFNNVLMVIWQLLSWPEQEVISSLGYYCVASRPAIRLCILPSIHPCVSLHPSIYPSLCLSASFHLSILVCVLPSKTQWCSYSLSECVWLHHCLRSCLYDCVCVWLPDWLSDWLSSCLSDWISSCLTNCLSNWLTSGYLSWHSDSAWPSV